jgi:hypothetical protein
MAQRLVTSFVNTVIPGAYPNVNVISQPVGLGASGVLVIMGEADGGPSYQTVSLANNAFAPNQLQAVASQYISGQIVDAMTALTAPSNDPDITNTANLVYIIKTNNSSKASAVLAALPSGNYGTLQDLNWGLPGNNYQYQVTELAAEVAPMVTGNTIPAFGALNPGLSPAFNLRLNGGALTPVTLPPGTYTTGTQVAAALTGLPGGVTASGNATTITLTVTADPNANAKGWGKALEVIEGAAPGDAASLGLSPGVLLVSSQESEVEVDINNSSTGLSETHDVEPAVSLMVGYAGTTATLTIASGMLTTTVTGGSGANLSIALSQYNTVAALAAFIASQTGYSAQSASSANQSPTSSLDSVAAIGIASSTAGAMPGRIKNAASAFQAAIATSKAVQLTPTATAGLPAPMALPAFLAGGARGATAAVDIVNALAQMGGIQANIIVPLFSQNATEDIALGLTDAGSTYTISAINAATKNHCIEYSTVELKHNRICILSYWDNSSNTYANAKESAQGLANYRCSLAMQQSMQVNSQGVITTFMPWYSAVVAAGMQAGGFYKSITNKLANVISFVDPDGFDSGNPGDVEDALLAGLLFMNQLTSGNAWVSDQTTYGIDTNFVYNSIQAVYDSDLIALDLAASFTSAFVGKSLADVSAATALSYLSQKMNGYLRIKLIAPSDDAPAGYKNASVTISAPTMTVVVEIKLATAIYFIPISINISAVQQAAG